MILQRMASAIKRQDWFQVTIEIFIVVIGIFLGLQVQEWNEDRKDAIEARAYTAQLVIDTKLAIEITVVSIEDKQKRIVLIDELLKVLRGKELNEDNIEVFEQALLVYMRFQPPGIKVGNVADILNGTVPDIIRDDELIRTMTELQRKINISLGSIEHPQVLLNMSINRIQKYYAPGAFVFAGIPASFELGDLRNSPGIAIIPASYDLEVLRNSPEFILAVQNAMSMQNHGLVPSIIIKGWLDEFLTYLEQKP